MAHKKVLIHCTAEDPEFTAPPLNGYELKVIEAPLRGGSPVREMEALVPTCKWARRCARSYSGP
jgi:hypothetical protein